jgi:hypothetical protein
LAQHKAGELTHAEPNVPEESRLQLFGKAGAAAAGGGGVTDDGTWQGLGLSKVLSEHMEALNFQEPTNVSAASCCQHSLWTCLAYVAYARLQCIW